MTTQMIPVLAIVGPTASGKTDLSIELAKQFHGEIVSFDSMQIYTDAPIATAVPTEAERQGIPHHLMSFLPADEQFSVAKYIDLARRVISEIHVRGKLPVLVGGTGLYYSSLLNNLQFADDEQNHLNIRSQLNKRLIEEGIQALYDELKSIDPQSAAVIHINNHVRVLRALEIYYSTGKTMHEQVEQSRIIPSPYSSCVIGLNYRNRTTLYERINLRVLKMIEAGLLSEIEPIYRRNPNGTLMQAIGIKEFIPYFEGNISLDVAIAQVQQSTRRYAKRQLTWFRRDDRVQWLYCDDYHSKAELLDDARRIVAQFLE